MRRRTPPGGGSISASWLVLMTVISPKVYDLWNCCQQKHTEISPAPSRVAHGEYKNIRHDYCDWMGCQQPGEHKYKGCSLTCYECYSTKNPACGSQFEPSAFEPVECESTMTMCALQRQEAIPRVQVSAFVRGCYEPGTLKGLNSSIGCRTWTNPDQGYAAIYCFCDADLCNAATPNVSVRHFDLAVTVLTYAIIATLVQRIMGHSEL